MEQGGWAPGGAQGHPQMPPARGYCRRVIKQPQHKARGAPTLKELQTAPTWQERSRALFFYFRISRQ